MIGRTILLVALVVPCWVMAQEAAAQTVTRVERGFLVQFEDAVQPAKSVFEVVINSYPGDIEILRSNENEIRFQESIILKAGDEDDARRQARKMAARMEQTDRQVVFRERDDEARGRTLKIRIPARLEIEASSSYGDIILEGGEAPVELATGYGDLEVRSLNAYLDLTTGAGDITVSRVEGPLTIESGGGDIEIDRIDSEIYVLTGGGDIEFSDVDGAVSATTGGGDIEGDRVAGAVVAYTGGGDIELEYIEGDLDLNTSGGSIELDEIIGNVRASTSGGDIDVRQIRGALIAETLAGDIDVIDMAGDIKVVCKVGDVSVRMNTATGQDLRHIDLRAENGDIDLRVPSGFGADVSVDLGHDGKLNLDKFRGDVEWTQSRRTSRNGQIRRATGTLNRGGVRVELSTGSGDVTITDRKR
jgi:DUF4097 and DUF4098 domain-containing protein YvlB